MFFGIADLVDYDGHTSHRSENDDARSNLKTGCRQSPQPTRLSLRTSSRNKHDFDFDKTPANTLLADGEALFLRENTTQARQKLTSSASRVRPSKQQVCKPSHQASQSPELLSDSGFSKYYDNNDDPVLESTGLGTRGSSSHSRGRNALYGVNQAGQLPTRSSNYVNCSIDTKVSNDYSGRRYPTDPSLDASPVDRPPSRQRHAFPTHLLDAREFFSPTKNHDNVNITPWDAEIEEPHEKTVSCPEEDEQSEGGANSNNQRPPSRYMVKAPRGNPSTPAPNSPKHDDSSRLPSRRGVPGSWNQVANQHYHNPKTDGFLDVDESVPPPFRVEISTEPAHDHPGTARCKQTIEKPYLSVRTRFRHRSRGGMRDQEGVSRERYLKVPSTRQDNRPSQPDWSGLDDEEVSSIDREIHDAVRLAVNTKRHISTKHLGLQSNDHDSRKPKSTRQWFHSTTYEDMDSDTAIANTPLFTREESFAVVPQLSDLHLDDFMGEPFVLNTPGLASIISTSATTSSSNTRIIDSQESGSLNTSLGRDFLSLFAQN